MKRLVHFLLMLLLLQNRAAAQQILFRHYSVPEGLPSSTVRAITQDRQGYLWFGTKNGLSRFDGYQFRNFQFRTDDSSSLGNNFIHCITVFDSTHLWIGTENSIYILDLETEGFTRFEPLKDKTVLDILRGRDGHMWITTRLNGLYRYDSRQQKLHNFKAGSGPRSVPGEQAATISNNQVTKLAEDNAGRIWIGSFGSGIDVYDPATAGFTNLRAGKSGLSNDFINVLHRGIDGAIWVGTMNGGLCRWQEEFRSFRVYRNDGTTHSIQDNIVRAICQVAGGKVYIGTEKGLSILDPESDAMVGYTSRSNDPFSLSDNAIYSIFPDRSGTLWVGTFFGGVNYFSEKGSAFELYYSNGDAHTLKGRAVSCFLEDKPGKFWVGTEDGGLHYFDAASHSFLQYPFLPKQQRLSYHNIHALIRDRQGSIWIGIFAGGVNVLDPRTGRVRVYAQEAGNEYSLNSNNVFCIYQDKEDQVWVGTDKGLNLYDAATNRFTRVPGEGVNNTIIYDIYEDAGKTIWIATYNHGLLSFNKKTGRWDRIAADGKKGSLASNKLTSLFDDHNGNLWIGSDGGGLHKYNFRSKTMTLYNEKTGMNANVVYGIQQDDAGLIWVTTNNGIYSVDPVSEKLRHFTRQDNLQSQQFNYKSFYKASDGKLFAGGIKGFNAFYPEQLSLPVPRATVSFTGFQLFNKPVTVSAAGSPLKQQINFTQVIELQHDQSVIGFEFAALHPGSSEKFSYAYRMDGFDADWNYVQEQRKATYTNLPPGSYTFRVKATADEGNWDVPESVLKLVIHPPFYKTPLAYLLYALLALAAGYGIYRYTSNYIRKQNQIRIERLKNKEEQEFYARKIEFFTVMAHEIRTPLSLIIAPLEKLLVLNKWHAEEREQLTVMDENAERLMGLVNQLLDFRRIESDAYVIKKENIEIVSTVQSIYSRFSALPYQKNTGFTMSTSIGRRMVEADPEVIDKILSNLLINAFKFARSRVRLSVAEIREKDTGETCIGISVEDDGIGIPEANIQNIFKQFFTTARGSHEYHNLGGSGIGLALASSLAEKHGARLLVESREGVMTTFTLELPVLAAPAAAIPAEEETETDEGQAGRPVVLVVEDDAAIQSFLARSFLSAGYQVLKAGHGKDALQVMEDRSVDLVFSDLMMPEMDGLELCRQLKANVQYSHIPFVLLTARSNRESEIEGIESGADAYIQKPFKWKHIAAIARNLLESREKLRQRFSEQPQSDVSVLATNTQDRQFMENVVRIIEARIMDPQLSVEELGRDLAMSRSGLHKKLKSLSGYVPNELIKLVKLKHAARLLQQGGQSMAEIAYLSGFNSPSYFSRCFLQQFHLTPKEYADKIAGKGNIDISDMDVQG